MPGRPGFKSLDHPGSQHPAYLYIIPPSFSGWPINGHLLYKNNLDSGVTIVSSIKACTYGELYLAKHVMTLLIGYCLLAASLLLNPIFIHLSLLLNSLYIIQLSNDFTTVTIYSKTLLSWAPLSQILVKLDTFMDSYKSWLIQMLSWLIWEITDATWTSFQSRDLHVGGVNKF